MKKKIPNLVKVRFENRYRPGEFRPGEYTYIADIPVSAGDIVKVPTRYGEATAMITAVNQPATGLPCRVGELKHITDPAQVDSLFAEKSEEAEEEKE